VRASKSPGERSPSQNRAADIRMPLRGKSRYSGHVAGATSSAKRAFMMLVCRDLGQLKVLLVAVQGPAEGNEVSVLLKELTYIAMQIEETALDVKMQIPELDDDEMCERKVVVVQR
jgi:hypothetical protein